MIFVICFNLFHCIQHIKPTNHPTRRYKKEGVLQYYDPTCISKSATCIKCIVSHLPSTWVLKYYNVLVYVLIMAILKRLTRCGHLSGQDYIQNQPNTSQGHISVALSVYIHMHANTCITYAYNMTHVYIHIHTHTHMCTHTHTSKIIPAKHCMLVVQMPTWPEGDKTWRTITQYRHSLIITE